MKQKYFLFITFFLLTKSLFAQIAYIGEIRMFAGSFPPRDWVECNGQLLKVEDYNMLYSVIGNQFGGNGNVNFAVPNLNDKVVVGSGPKDGGSNNYILGQSAGSNTATLNLSTMATHSHNSNVNISTADANSLTAGSDKYLGAPVNNFNGNSRQVKGYGTSSSNTDLNPTPTTTTGFTGPLPFSIQQPVLAVRYIICVNGELPQRPN